MKAIANTIVAVLRVSRSVLFLIGISLPLIGFVLQWQGTGQLESKGKRAELPRMGKSPYQWGRFLLAYRKYFNEEFGFRKDLIRLHAIAKFKLFGIASNEKVLLGKEGWFFLSKDFSSVEDGRNLRPFTLDELEVWKQTLERRRDALKARGIHYIFVVAPNKETIYSEYLPASYTHVHRKSRLDQLLDYMSEESNVKIVDLRPALLAAKGKAPLYYKTDSHWNAYGACYACEPIVKALRELFPQIPPYFPDQFVVHRKRNAYHGDLLHLSGLGDLVSEDDIIVSPSQPRQARRAELAEFEYSGTQHCFATECDAPGLPRAVVFRDSFFMAMHPFVSEQFRRTVFIWQNHFDETVILHEPCDVVIQEVVERTLIWSPPGDTFEGK